MTWYVPLLNRGRHLFNDAADARKLRAARFAFCSCHQEALKLLFVFLDLLCDIDAAQDTQQQQNWQLRHKSHFDDPQEAAPNLRGHTRTFWGANLLRQLHGAMFEGPKTGCKFSPGLRTVKRGAAMSANDFCSSVCENEQFCFSDGRAHMGGKARRGGGA